MILAMGHSPVVKYLQKLDRPSNFFIYTEFYDSKKDLLEKRYNNYIRKLWELRTTIKIALYPDYVKRILSVPKNISYIIPIHDLSDVEVADKLREAGFDVWIGFASDKRYRNYEIEDFVKANYKKWYLGVSTKHEVREALLYNFQGFDITTFLFGKHEDRKDSKKLASNILNFVKEISKPQGRQLTLYDFCGKLGSLTGERR